jgi:hypothetical protein
VNGYAKNFINWVCGNAGYLAGKLFGRGVSSITNRRYAVSYAGRLPSSNTNHSY